VPSAVPLLYRPLLRQAATWRAQNSLSCFIVSLLTEGLCFVRLQYNRLSLSDAYLTYYATYRLVLQGGLAMLTYRVFSWSERDLILKGWLLRVSHSSLDVYPVLGIPWERRRKRSLDLLFFRNQNGLPKAFSNTFFLFFRTSILDDPG